tara:strand:+ start:213848 stop:214942 length:1095 start_codon:yes stop_codon:yes gene_type:complete
MIVEISAQDVVRQCRSALGVASEDKEIDDVFLVALLRHTAGVLCPCSRTALRAALIESLSFLHDCSDDLSSRLESLTDDLIVAGDLLELSDVTTGDTEVKGTWVFTSPPAFVERKSGSIFLTGIVPDRNNVLPEALSLRVVHTHGTRFIDPEPGEDLVGTLTEEGLIQLPESVWLKEPKMQSLASFLEKPERSLASESQCAPISGLEIIDQDAAPTFYRGRWATPGTQTGNFVARRPQEFGAPIWCFVELEAGMLVRLIDLPIGTYRWRACDAAWHLQMAIDRINETPQRYRISDKDSVRRVDFFSPLPLWAERRLMVLGRKCPGEKSLFAYEIPAGEAEQEEEFLQNNLWLAPYEDESRGRRA